MELIIQGNEKLDNKKLFEFLFALKKQIQNEFGGDLDWSPDKNPKRFWIRK